MSFGDDPATKSERRIYLSPPHIGSLEVERVLEALESNWVAPLGPQVDAFEREFADHLGGGYATAVSSGTAALHLALRILGVEPGDEVLCPSFTFVASVSPVTYLGGTPVLVDCDPSSWNLSPDLVEEELESCRRKGKMPRAVVSVDILGQSADYDALQRICRRYEVSIVEDAAESLGATYRDRPVGSFGRAAVFSFNGNKIITTGGGGMLAAKDRAFVEKARHLATQARDPFPHYEHSTIGYNYRMSNVLAAIGRAQLAVLQERVEIRRRNFDYYFRYLSEIPGLEFMPEAPYGRSSRWLTCITIDPGLFGSTREDLRLALEKSNIESRPLWKPMHLQPVFRGCRALGGPVAEKLFERGLCLPSGSNLSPEELDRVIEIVRNLHERGPAHHRSRT